MWARKIKCSFAAAPELTRAPKARVLFVLIGHLGDLTGVRVIELNQYLVRLKKMSHPLSWAHQAQLK